MAEHIYIMGAGRSGTTLLSVLLGSCPRARAAGELLHFPWYWSENHRCSCGLGVQACGVWHAAGARLGGTDRAAVAPNKRLTESVEKHARAFQYLLAPRTVPLQYLRLQEQIFAALANGDAIVDESKYVSRALALSRLERQKFRFVYLVRDCRGVLHSFSKAAQRRKSLLSGLLYYFSVNLAAQLAIWTRLRGRAIKLRYEDLVAYPERELTRLGRFLDMDVSDVIARIRASQPLPVGHLVSGNRLKSQGQVVLRSGEEWRQQYGTVRRTLVYFLCFPLQLINRYSI